MKDPLPSHCPILKNDGSSALHYGAERNEEPSHFDEASLLKGDPIMSTWERNVMSQSEFDVAVRKAGGL